MSSHCPSYYAATVNQPQLQFPQLKGEQRADVCVVGGGFSGVSTAISLAERGYKVAVIEQNLIGWGASGRNGGQLSGGINGEEKLLKVHGQELAAKLFEFGYRGHEIIEQRIEKYNIQCDYKKGSIHVAIKDRQLTDLQTWHDAIVGYDMQDQLHLINQQEMPKVLGTQMYKGGIINRRNAHLHPLNLCLGEAAAAQSLGVQLYENSEVTDIIHGTKPKVVTAEGSVTADFVVLAGNAYHHLEQKRLSGLLFPAGTYIIATEPLTDEEVANINPQDLAVCDMNVVVDYFRLSADKRLLFGGRCNYSGRDPKDIKKTMFPRLKQIYPQLANKRIDYEWGGYVGIVLNRAPLIGRLKSNVFYAMGYSGHGINVSHLAGEVVAEAVGGTFEKMDLFDRVKHHRIPFSRQFGNNMVALGMLYYRLLDLM